jgi:hypothetical protein
VVGLPAVQVFCRWRAARASAPTKYRPPRPVLTKTASSPLSTPWHSLLVTPPHPHPPSPPPPQHSTLASPPTPAADNAGAACVTLAPAPTKQAAPLASSSSYKGAGRQPRVTALARKAASHLCDWGICLGLDSASCQPPPPPRRRPPPSPAAPAPWPMGVVLPSPPSAQFRLKLAPSLVPASRFRFRHFPTFAFVSPQCHRPLVPCLLLYRPAFSHRLHLGHFLYPTRSDTNFPLSASSTPTPLFPGPQHTAFD